MAPKRPKQRKPKQRKVSKGKPPKNVTLHQKKMIRLKNAAHDGNISLQDLANWAKEQFGMNFSLSDVSKYRGPMYAHLDTDNSKDLDQRQRQRKEHWPEVEEALLTWVLNKEGQIPITIAVLREKAVFFWNQLHHHRSGSAPSFSAGWLEGFKRRAQLSRYTLHGEAASVAEDAEEHMKPIRAIIEQYEPKDIFNCDETGLFWRMTPDKSYGTKPMRGKKKDKARITAHVCCNADGSERLPIWWIGTAKSPHAFRSVRIENVAIWKHNKKAWMTAALFEDWLKWFDNRMRNRKVVLLMDNFSAHTLAASRVADENGNMVNTRLVFLPPNTTSVYQPLDQGIIMNLKAVYKRLWVHFMLQENEAGRNPIDTMDVLHAIRWGNLAWTTEVKSSSIKNCFQKGLNIFGADETGEKDDDPMNELKDEYHKLRSMTGIRDLMDIHNFLNPVEEEVTDPEENLEQHIIDALTTKTETPKEDEEESAACEAPVEKVSYKIVREGLRMACLLEEQRPGGSMENIRFFQRHMKVLECQELQELPQKTITSFFAVN